MAQQEAHRASCARRRLRASRSARRRGARRAPPPSRAVGLGARSRSASSSPACSGSGWNGGPGRRTRRHDARSAGPPTSRRSSLVPLGALMVARSELVAVRPVPARARASRVVGLMLALGRRTAATSGDGLERARRAAASARPARRSSASLLMLVGVLFLTGASLGAILRRSGHAVRHASTRVRRERARRPHRARSRAATRRRSTPLAARTSRRSTPSQDYPDVVGDTQPPPLVSLVADVGATTPTEDTQQSLFDVAEPRADSPSTGCPTASLLRRSKPGSGPNAEARRARRRGCSSRRLANFGVDATVVGQISGPRVTRYELQLAPGTKVGEGRAAQGRPLVRARDDRDPHPRADPRQAGGRRRGAEPLAEPRHARRHLRRPARDREPAVGLARQGHLRRRRLDRPRPHAAPADRRHDRLGQVGLHQHDPHLDPAARDAGRGADDPDRPEADRAQLLRVDPAPAHAGRLEPEGGERRPRSTSSPRWSAATSASRRVRARNLPEANRALPQARRARRCRTCSS